MIFIILRFIKKFSDKIKISYRETTKSPFVILIVSIIPRILRKKMVDFTVLYTTLS